MPAFLLTLWLGSEEAVLQAPIDAEDEQGAKAQAPAIIAQNLDRPGILVLLSPDGHFQAGAGFWSRSGTYKIEAQPPFRGQP